MHLDLIFQFHFGSITTTEHAINKKRVKLMVVMQVQTRLINETRLIANRVEYCEFEKLYL